MNGKASINNRNSYYFFAAVFPSVLRSQQGQRGKNVIEQSLADVEEANGHFREARLIRREQHTARDSLLLSPSQQWTWLFLRRVCLLSRKGCRVKARSRFESTGVEYYRQRSEIISPDAHKSAYHLFPLRHGAIWEEPYSVFPQGPDNHEGSCHQLVNRADACFVVETATQIDGHEVEVITENGHAFELNLVIIGDWPIHVFHSLTGP